MGGTLSETGLLRLSILMAKSRFAGKNGYVYVIETNNYININATYCDLANYTEQMEFSISGGISASEVVGACQKTGGVLSDVFIPNPNYGGK